MIKGVFVHMSAAQIIFGIFEIILSLVIIVAVLAQSARNARLSGTIAGGAETFFGKNKGQSIDSVLQKWTGVGVAIFLAVTLIASWAIAKFL